MSGTDQLLAIIRREIAVALTLRGSTRQGLVQSYGPGHAAKVLYQPEGVLSGWLPVGTMGAGPGWGMGFAPMVGQQVTVHFLEGDHDSGIIGPSIHSTVDTPPPNLKAGMAWMIDPSGSSVLLTNDGNVSINAPGNLSATVGGNLSSTVSGDANMVVSGNLTTQAETWSHTGNLSVAGNATVSENVTVGGTLTT